MIDIATIAVTEVLLRAVDPDAPKPEPVVGEPVTAYWLRVVQYQAWERGREAGLRDYDDRMPDYSPNPFAQPLSQEEPK